MKYRNEINDGVNENVNNRINNSKAITSKPFEYETKLTGSTKNDDNKLDVEVVVPLNISVIFGDLLIFL